MRRAGATTARVEFGCRASRVGLMRKVPLVGPVNNDNDIGLLVYSLEGKKTSVLSTFASSVRSSISTRSMPTSSALPS